ncbi:uncharacterized protein [Argopecten irradians]|uniref:uncharacterized protein n=1 Tax=Argopecten irradians TaxID=31199 RepID=UPI0037214921
MAAILNRQKIVREFDFVGEILNNMEPRYAEKTNKKTEKSSKKSNGQSNGSSKTVLASNAEKSAPVTDVERESPKAPETNKPSQNRTVPMEVDQQIPGPSGTQTCSPVGNNFQESLASVLTNMQNMMATQMQMFEEMRSSDQRSFISDGMYSEHDSVDVCGQIDALLGDSDSENDDKTENDETTVECTTNRSTVQIASNVSQGPVDDHDELPQCMREIAQDLSNSDATGPDLNNEKLTKLLSDMLSKRMPDEKLKTKMDEYLRPANVDMLQAPKMNPEIWRKISHNTKSRDLRFQRAQDKMLKGLVPLARTLQKITSDRKEITDDKTKAILDEIMKATLDSFMLISTASQDISQRRRELIKPDLNNQFSSLCSTNNPVTTQLFGDDLHRSMKEISETNRVASQVSYGNYQYGKMKGQTKYSNRGKFGGHRGRFQPYDGRNPRNFQAFQYQGKDPQYGNQQHKPKNYKRGQQQERK